MEREDLRISKRENIRYAGRARTAFFVHAWNETAQAYVFAGQHTAPGHDASEEQCRQAAARAMLESDD
jgi:hypothetical protein